MSRQKATPTKAKPVNRSAHLKKARQAAFLKAFADLGNVSQAAKAAQIDRGTHYLWLKDEPEYSQAFEAAKEEAGDALEAEARRRAIKGWLEPVWYLGEEVGHVRKYSDTLLIFLMKGAMPDKYRENRRTEISGIGGKAIPLTLVLKEGEDVP